jgi:hypothetical protein
MKLLSDALFLLRVCRFSAPLFSVPCPIFYFIIFLSNLFFQLSILGQQEQSLRSLT